MSKPLTFPTWPGALASLLITAFGAVAGIAGATWQVRTALSAQTEAIASLRQTIDEAVKPYLAKVDAHADRLHGHDTRLAVIERACCDDPSHKAVTP